jgi:hypothetical protein
MLPGVAFYSIVFDIADVRWFAVAKPPYGLSFFLVPKLRLGTYNRKL